MPRFSRIGVSALSSVAAFLAGIFFTSVIVIYQQSERIKDEASFVFANQMIKIGLYPTLAFFLLTSIILFVFSSIFFAIACSNPDDVEFDRLSAIAMKPFK